VLANALHDVLQRIDNAMSDQQRPAVRLLAVSKTRSATEVAALAQAWRELRPGHVAGFGENYVQEAAAKCDELASAGIEWHLIGHLQSNKAAQAAALFDWVQTVDRSKLVKLLARHRPAGRAPLNVLVQVNVDDEDNKHGCAPDAVAPLAAEIARHPELRLRGLMAIPAPDPDPARRRRAFARMRALQSSLRAGYPDVDTLSMGMSDDLELAIEEGATMVRVGTALFGPRAANPAVATGRGPAASA
jgi:PLP dependent protein